MIHIMSKEEKELWNKAKELISKKYKSKEELENRVFILETQLKNDIKMLEIKQNKIDKQKEVLDKIKEYITSYESINTIQECEIPENNIGLDEETFIEMVNRYMKVHDKILDILEEIE